jgi:AIPR protein
MAWYLENYFHLDETEIQDAICDRSFDKGFDAVYVNKMTERIYAFQNELSKSQGHAVIGDTALKEFYGSLTFLQNGDSVRMLETSVQINDELKKLLRREKIAEKVESGYEIRGIFLTNRYRNDDAKDYLKHCPIITLVDIPELQQNYVPIDEVISIETPITFNIKSLPVMDYPIDSKVRMVIAPISAQELIQMQGIMSGELFAPNVRYFLGKSTPVNKGIEKSIVDKKNEHKYFPTFHNGLVVRCKIDKVSEKELIISDYSVVNGCQSLRGLFDNENDLTPDLRVMVKFIQVESNPNLVKEITYRTNNQNAIKTRNLQSNSTIQKRLRDEIKHKYNGEYLYRISRGQSTSFKKEKVIENTLASQVLLSFDLKKPENSHLIDGRIFADLHGDIFGRPEVDADRIIALNEVYKICLEQLKNLEDKGFASYTLTRFLMLYLVRKVLDKDELGRKFIENLSPFIETDANLKNLRFCIGTIANVLTRILDSYYIYRLKQEKESENQEENIEENEKKKELFDYKSELKNADMVERIKDFVVLTHYPVFLDTGATKPFSQLWMENN